MKDLLVLIKCAAHDAYLNFRGSYTDQDPWDAVASAALEVVTEHWMPLLKPPVTQSESARTTLPQEPPPGTMRIYQPMTWNADHESWEPAGYLADGNGTSKVHWDFTSESRPMLWLTADVPIPIAHEIAATVETGEWRANSVAPFSFTLRLEENPL